MIYDRTIGIFPTPISFYRLDRDFTNQEYNFIIDQKKDVFRNTTDGVAGNLATENAKILNHVIMHDLKNELMKCLYSYYENVLSTSDKIQPLITQSWLNFTEIGQNHHNHYHPNSFVSGVLYIEADERYDTIVFDRDIRDTFILNRSDNHQFNAHTWIFPVKKYDIILFPSYLKHNVPIKNNGDLRISLAFNSFFKGTIGNPSVFTELTL